MVTIQDFSGYKPTWCPGCGDHGIGVGLKEALVQMGYEPSSIFVIFGIGCSGNMNDFLNAYAIHSLHGRAIPNAIGVKIANHKLPVIVVAGDGDCYGEGGNHFIHACRGNHDITVIVHDNGVYGLTTGQVAPTAKKGAKSKSTPEGIIESPLNFLTTAIVQSATFVGQAYAGKVPPMVELIKKGIAHRGFSLINVLQPCVTFNKPISYQYYQERIYDLPKDYNPGDFDQALKKSFEPNKEDKFPLGILYQEEKPTYTDQLIQLKEKTLLEKEAFKAFESIVSDFE